jgi:hypothetical protein
MAGWEEGRERCAPGSGARRMVPRVQCAVRGNGEIQKAQPAVCRPRRPGQRGQRGRVPAHGAAPGRRALRGKWHLEPRTCSPFASAVAIIMSSARGLTRAGGWRWHRVSLVLARLRRALSNAPMPLWAQGAGSPAMREPARRRGGRPADSFQHGWELP